MDEGIILVNFAYKMTEEQKTQLTHMIHRPIGREIMVDVNINRQMPLTPQAVALIEKADLSIEEWQGPDIIINPPSLVQIAIVILAELHGWMGHFPTITVIRPVPDSTPTRYEIGEVLNLQALRENARPGRYSNKSASFSL